MWIKNGDYEDWVDMVTLREIIVPVESNMRSAARLVAPVRCAGRLRGSDRPRRVERARFERIDPNGERPKPGRRRLATSRPNPNSPVDLAKYKGTVWRPTP
jgi:hypothetical protein